MYFYIDNEISILILSAIDKIEENSLYLKSNSLYNNRTWLKENGIDDIDEFLSSDFDRIFESKYNIFGFWENTFNLYHFFNDYQINYSDRLSESQLGDLINI